MSGSAGSSYGQSRMDARPNPQKAGCAGEWDALFRRYEPRVTRLCLRWARGHRADAQDLLAEAYLKAVSASEQRGTPVDNPLAWLSTVIANLARDRQRVRRRGAWIANDDGFIETVA